MRGAFWGYANIVEALLKHGADVTIKDRSGRTAADYAIARRSEDDNDVRNKLATMQHLLAYDKDNSNYVFFS